jgi:ABC-type phosphate transport system substrate-binding protein
MKTNGDTFMKMRLSILLFVLAGTALCRPALAQVLVIANPSVGTTEVSKAELRDVFTGAASSVKGTAQVTPVLLKQGAVNEDFLNLYVGKSDSAFRASWRSLPRTMDSDAAVVEYVAHTPGAIGYIGKGSPHEGVKTLIVR